MKCVAILIAACLLLVLNQCAAGKQSMTPEARLRAMSSVLQSTVGQAFERSAKKRAHDVMSAKSSPLARALIDRTSKRYNRDLYAEIFGGASKDETIGFFKEVCGFNINDPVEQDPRPLTPDDIRAASDIMGEFNGDLKEQLQSLKKEMDEVAYFYENEDLSVDENQEKLEEMAIGFLTSVGMQENGLTEEGVCALGGVASMVFRLIEHGTEGFRDRRHEDDEDDEGCFQTVITYWTIMAEHYYSVERLAWEIANGNVLLLEEMTKAVMYDVHCIAAQLDYVNDVLEEGKTFDGTRTEEEAWTGTLTVMYLEYFMIVEWGHMRATLAELDKLGKELDAIYKDWFGEDYDDRGLRSFRRGTKEDGSDGQNGPSGPSGPSGPTGLSGPSGPSGPSDQDSQEATVDIETLKNVLERFLQKKRKALN